MQIVNLAKAPDTDFIKEVENESGQRISACYQCGNCTAGCPCASVYDLQVNQIMRALQLGQKDLILSSKSIWRCLTCSTCSARCPNNIDVALVMDVLRKKAAAAGHVQDKPVQTFWKFFLLMLRRFGRSWELGTMGAYMLRSGRVTTDVDLAPQALAKRKLPFLPHNMSGNPHVAAIFQRFDEQCRREGRQA